MNFKHIGLFLLLALLSPFIVARAQSFAPSGPPLANGGVAASAGLPQNAAVPGIKPFRDPTIYVDETSWWRVYKGVQDGAKIDKDQNGKPLADPIADALRNSHPGDTLLVSGDHPYALRLGDPKPSWEKGWVQAKTTLRDVQIVGTDPEKTRIHGVSIGGDVRNGSGVDELMLAYLTVCNEPYAAWCMNVDVLEAHAGRIRAYGVSFVPVDPSAWDGRGMKWGANLGRCSIDFRKCRFSMALEHKVYAHELSWNGDESYLIDNIDLAPSGRTAYQFVSRLTTEPGEQGIGRIVILRNHLKADGDVNDGGFALTVSGHLGPVEVYDNVIEARGLCGGITFWTDEGKGPYALTPDGFHCPSATLVRNRVDCTDSLRNCLDISGVGVARIASFVHVGKEAAISLDNWNGGPVKNGVVLCYLPAPASKWMGWQAGTKVELGHQPTSPEPLHIFTDAEIDLLAKKMPVGWK